MKITKKIQITKKDDVLNKMTILIDVFRIKNYVKQKWLK